MRPPATAGSGRGSLPHPRGRSVGPIRHRRVPAEGAHASTPAGLRYQARGGPAVHEARRPIRLPVFLPSLPPAPFPGSPRPRRLSPSVRRLRRQRAAAVTLCLLLGTVSRHGLLPALALPASGAVHHCHSGCHCPWHRARGLGSPLSRVRGAALAGGGCRCHRHNTGGALAPPIELASAPRPRLPLPESARQRWVSRRDLGPSGRPAPPDPPPRTGTDVRRESGIEAPLPA